DYSFRLPKLKPTVHWVSENQVIRIFPKVSYDKQKVAVGDGSGDFIFFWRERDASALVFKTFHLYRNEITMGGFRMKPKIISAPECCSVLEFKILKNRNCRIPGFEVPLRSKSRDQPLCENSCAIVRFSDQSHRYYRVRGGAEEGANQT